MEEQYWKQFTKTGAITDYLGYRMEVYRHPCGRQISGGNREESGQVCQQDCCIRMSGQKKQEKQV